MTAGRKLGQKSITILKALIEVGGMMARDALESSFTLLPGERVAMSGGRVYYKQAYNLKRSKHLEIKWDKKNQSFFHLTPKGRLAILKYLHLEKLKLKKWDGRWRVLIFDIPEDRKKMREYLRTRLTQRWDFYPLQESVYITPFPVTSELNKYLAEFNLKKYTRYLTVTEIDGEEELKAHFGIK